MVLQTFDLIICQNSPAQSHNLVPSTTFKLLSLWKWGRHDIYCGLAIIFLPALVEHPPNKIALSVQCQSIGYNQV